MKRAFLTGLLILLSACATVSGGSSQQPTGAAGDFSLSDIDGRTVHLSDYAGKVVMVDFWATWCDPCVAELPLLEKIYEKYKSKGFVVLAVSMDGPETTSGVAPLVQRLGLTFPVLLDDQTIVTAQLNPARIAPFSLIIDRSGKIARTRSGYNVGDEKFVEADVKKLVGP